MFALFSQLQKRAALLTGMAARLGVDLDDRSGCARGFEAERYRSMLVRCGRCSEAGRCSIAMDQVQTLPAPPPYCRNAGLFRELMH